MLNCRGDTIVKDPYLYYYGVFLAANRKNDIKHLYCPKLFFEKFSFFSSFLFALFLKGFILCGLQIIAGSPYGHFEGVILSRVAFGLWQYCPAGLGEKYCWRKSLL